MPPYCGSKFGFQQMLADLGYYAGAIDGKIGSGSQTAAVKFAADQGISVGGGITSEFCDKLIKAWVAATAPEAAPAEPAPAPAPRMRVKPTTDVFQAGARVMRDGQVARQQQAPPSNGPPAVNGNGGIKAWWRGASTTTKVAVGVGAAAVIGIIGYAIFGGKKKGGELPATANRYRSNKATGARARAKSGRLITLKSGRRYGHQKPPKRYWKMGARRSTDYAAPSQYGYPLVFRSPSGKVNQKRTRTHIIAAKSKFAKNKRRYPMKLRRQIARNINQASNRFGVGGKVVKP